MKLLFKPIKIIFGIVIFLLVIIGIILALLYKNVKVPPVNSTSPSIQELLDEAIVDLADDNNLDKKLLFNLDPDAINKMISDFINKDINSINENDIIYENSIYKIQRPYLEYKNSKVQIVTGVHINIGFTYFKSAVTMVADMNYEKGIISIKIEKVKIGSIGAKWSLNQLQKVIDLEELFKGVFGNSTTFNKEDLIISINANELLGKDTLGSLLLELLNDNELLKMNYIDSINSYGITFDLNNIHDKNNFLSYETNKLSNKVKLDSFFETAVVKSLLSTPGSILINEEELNNVLHYYFKDMYVDGYIQRIKMTEENHLLIGLPYVTILNNKITLNIPIKIGNDDGYFNSKMSLDLIFKKNNNDLNIELNDLKFGNLIIDDAISKEVIKSITANDFNTIIINDFFEMMNAQDIDIHSITISNNNITFNYETLVTDLISDLLASNDVPAELKDIVNEISNKVNNEPIDQLVSTLIDEINKLDEVTKNKIFDIIYK